MAIRRLSTASIKTGSKSNKLWDQDTAQGAMVPIASSSNGAAVFTNIPQTFQDLYFVAQLRGVNANTIEFFFSNLNLSSSTIYSYTSLQGDGGSASSSRTNQGNSAFFLGVGPGANSIANVFGTLQMWILDYKNTSNFKTVLYRFAADQNGSGETRLGVALFRSTDAITSVQAFGGNGSANGSSATLYGIKAGV